MIFSYGGGDEGAIFLVVRNDLVGQWSFSFVFYMAASFTVDWFVFSAGVYGDSSRRSLIVAAATAMEVRLDVDRPVFFWVADYETVSHGVAY